MKNIYSTIVMLVFTVGTNVFAQGIINRDITWYTNQSVELHSSVTMDKSGRIITHGKTTIDYVVSDTQTLTFSITKIEGTWADPNVAGTLTYRVKYQGKPGKIIIERAATLTAVIDFTEVAPEAMKQKILITSFQ